MSVLPRKWVRNELQPIRVVQGDHRHRCAHEPGRRTRARPPGLSSDDRIRSGSAAPHAHPRAPLSVGARVDVPHPLLPSRSRFGQSTPAIFRSVHASRRKADDLFSGIRLPSRQRAQSSERACPPDRGTRGSRAATVRLPLAGGARKSTGRQASRNARTPVPSGGDGRLTRSRPSPDPGRPALHAREGPVPTVSGGLLMVGSLASPA